MGRAKSAADALLLGSQRSVGKGNEIINSEVVFKKLQPAVERNYKKMIQVWAEYQTQNPKESPYDLKSLKDFIRKFAYSIDGEEGIDVPGSETVRKHWNAFTAAWEREYPERPIPRGIAKSVTQFINGPLTDEMGMPKTKRPRRFATKNVMLTFARQLWATDWVEHRRPATLVDDWGLLLGNAYSSSRIGEYIESSCRSGTGRGLYFKDLTFAVFINEAGVPEFAIQLTRDAKNMTRTPDKRPQHALYEGLAPGPLCFNPILPFLARLLAYEAFRDYSTIEDLLKIAPAEGEMTVIQWKDELLETPFFRSQSSDEIETAAAFSHRMRLLGLRAGYATPPRNHDIRAEGLHLMNQFESESTRMVYAGHTDPNTLGRHYLPRNGADGQAAYHSHDRRALVLDLFRGLTIPRNPRLWHCLPAKERFECEHSPDIIRIDEELLTLRTKSRSESQEKRKKLYSEKRKLLAKRLRDWQKRQPVKHDDPPGYHRAVFDRVRFLMPERDRLAQSMFEIDMLRSPTGLAVLQDMLALYRKRSNVEFRPGLEPEKCRCTGRNGHSYEWRHVYECYKTATVKSYGFSELCFICSEWFHGTDVWEEHCRCHLDDPGSLPTWCDPLTYGGVLARAGYCPFCLENGRLPASARMHQFKIRWIWLDHIQTHIKALQNAPTPVRCPRLHSHCPAEFDSVLQLEFHLEDAFGVERIGDVAKLKRSACTQDDFPPAKKKMVKRCCSEPVTDDIMALSNQWTFFNTDADNFNKENTLSSTPSDPSQESTPPCSSGITALDNRAPSNCSTPLSSIPLEEIMDPAMFLEKTDTDGKVVDSSSSYNIPEAKSGTSHGDNDTLHDTSTLLSNTEEGHRTAIRDTLRLCIPLHGTAVELDATVAYPESDPDQVITDKSITRRGSPQDHQDGTDYERLLLFDQDATEFEVESLVAKGRIGRRVWYKVKWKGYPESDNSWVKRKDIGLGAIADYEARRPRHQAEFKFERLVSSREVEGITLYEAKWQGRPESDNIWVDKWDLGAKVVAAFKAGHIE